MREKRQGGCGFYRRDRTWICTGVGRVKGQGIGALGDFSRDLLFAARLGDSGLLDEVTGEIVGVVGFFHIFYVGFEVLAVAGCLRRIGLVG